MENIANSVNGRQPYEKVELRVMELIPGGCILNESVKAFQLSAYEEGVSL